MSTPFPVNPNAGINDGNPDDDVMPEVEDSANSEDTPDGADRGGAGPDAGGAGASEDLPYRWSDLEATEADESQG